MGGHKRGDVAMKTVFLKGMLPTQGSVRLIALRLVLLVLAMLPGIWAAVNAIDESAGRLPSLAGVTKPMPIVHLIRLAEYLNGYFVALLAIGVVVAFIGQQLLLAGGLVILDPRLEKSPRVWRSVVDTGTLHLWTFLRIALFNLLILSLGLAGIHWLFDALRRHGLLAGWSAQSLVLDLSWLQLIISLVWVGFVGSWGFWCRVLSVVDQRRRVRRTAFVALFLFWRHPFSGPLFYALTSFTSFCLGAWVLALWRQSSSPWPVWALLWALVLLAQACIWHWQVRSARLLVENGNLAVLRECADSPWGITRLMRWVWRALSRTRTADRSTAES